MYQFLNNNIQNNQIDLFELRFNIENNNILIQIVDFKYQYLILQQNLTNQQFTKILDFDNKFLKYIVEYKFVFNTFNCLINKLFIVNKNL